MRETYPLAYTEDYSWFYGRKFTVTPDVLIPRPETETIIDVAKSLIGNSDNMFQGNETNFLSQVRREPSQAGLSPPGEPQSELDGQKISFLTRRNPLSELPIRDFTILDVGTGSGIIAITLSLEFPEAKVTATDISADALKIAQKNAKLHKTPINFINSDLLNCFFSSTSDVNPLEKTPAGGSFQGGEIREGVEKSSSAKAKFNVITANLPYVDPSWPWIDHTALAHEPPEALFAKNHGLALIKKLIQQAPPHLTPNGILVLEHDPSQLAELTAYAQKHHFTPLSHSPYVTSLTYSAKAPNFTFN